MGNQSKKKVLVVEDNVLNLKLFRDLLEANNFEVHDTGDGLTALDMVRDIKPDLVLMDIQLHGVSGFDLIKDMKSEAGTKEIPIIAVTAFAMKDDKEKILASGCEDYIAKPISIGPFIETVKKYTGL